MTNYKWTDNPTEANVSAYNPDILNECLMHLKYDNLPVQNTKYCFNFGNIDAYGNTDIVNANFTTNIEYAVPGSYAFNAPVSGFYQVVMVGGGGSAMSGYTSCKTFSYAGGGSGAAFAGEVYLNAGMHYVSVGSAGGNNNTSLDNNLIIAGGGGNATLVNYNLLATNQQGGLVYVTGSVKNITINLSGIQGNFNNYSAVQYGGPSVFYGYGKGADSCCGSGATSGYFSIKLNSENGNFISYKVGGNYPNLIGTLASGEQFVLNGLNSDNAELLADGNYIKFVGPDGSSDLLQNTVYRQAQMPSASIGDVWFCTAKEPCSSLQWDGSQWVDYNKIPLCSFTISDGLITEVANFAYNQNGYDVNIRTPLGKPSGKFMDLILPASGSTLIAPYNGFIHFAALNASNLQIYNISGGNFWDVIHAPNAAACVSVPCKRGDTLQIYYELTTFRWLRCYQDGVYQGGIF